MFNRLAFNKAQKRAESGHRIKAVSCSVNFFVRTDSRTIVWKVRVNGQVSPFMSTGIQAKREDFNTETLEITNDPVNTARLIALKAEVLKVFKERELTGRSLEPRLIRDIAIGLRGHDEKGPTLVEVIKTWLERKSVLLNNGLVQSSLNRYRRYGQILEHFITSKYGKDTLLDHLKPSTEYDLFEFLKGIKRYGHNYSLKVIQFLKTILDYAVAHEWVDRNVLVAVRFRKERKEVKTLDMADIKRLQQAHFIESTLTEVRDVFLFCAFTGLAFTDVKSLTESHLVNVDGIKSILKNRDKVAGQQSFVPLFPEALEILERYRNHPICLIKGVMLPVLSNQKMNQHLKTIGNIVGIKETLHTHLGRKTFTMFAEEHGFRLNETAIMMGHSTTYMTEQSYYRQRRETVIKQFKNVFGEDSQKQAG